MQKSNYLVYVLTLSAVAFWGLSYVWMKVVFQYYDPITTMFIRLSLASVFMYTLLAIMGKKEKIQKEDYPAFLALSFFPPFAILSVRVLD